MISLKCGGVGLQRKEDIVSFSVCFLSLGRMIILCVLGEEGSDLVEG